MEITSIHKYIALNKLVNGTVEVLFAGQPCLTVSEGVWKINPVFAKLVYGANIFEDIPTCKETHNSDEETIAAGLIQLHELGAFTTEVDFPEDTYAATMNMVEEDVKNFVFSNTRNIMEAYTSYNAMMKSIIDNTFVSPVEYKKVVVEKTIDTEENATAPEKISEVKTDNVFSKWTSQKLDEARMPLNGHPYHKKSDNELRYIIKDAGEAAIAMKDHSPKAESKYLDQVNDASTVLHYRKTNKSSVVEGRSEYTANMSLSTAQKPQASKKKVWLKGTDGKMLSDHDSEADALRTWKNLSVNKGVKIMRNESEDVTDKLVSESDAEYQQWEDSVRAKHPLKKLQFKGRIEKGLNTTSAEESGKDRSYGVWDHDENKGHVFEEESEKEEEKEIVAALKKDRKFIAKGDKDSK